MDLVGTFASTAGFISRRDCLNDTHHPRRHRGAPFPLEGPGAVRQMSRNLAPIRRHPHRPVTNWHSAAREKLTGGDRAADVLRNGMGSWRFVGGFFAFMIVWAGLNAIAPRPWDTYPYILLNLFLSMLAGLQGAILLIAAKRQDGIAAALAQHDYDTNVAAKAEIEELMSIGREQLELVRRLSGATASHGVTPRVLSAPTSRRREIAALE